MTRLAQVLTFVFFPAALGAGHAAEVRRPGQESLRDFVLESAGRQAFGLYLFGRKVGWVVEEVRLGTHEGKEVAVATEEGQFTVAFFGQASTGQLHTTEVFALEGDGRLVFAQERSVQDDTETLITAALAGGELEIATKIAARKTVRRVAPPKETLSLMRGFSRWLKGTPQQGAKFESYSTDLEERDVNTKVRYTFHEKRSMQWGGVPTDVFMVEMDLLGAVIETTVTSTGRLVKGKMAGLLDVRAEEEAAAKKLDGPPLDMLAAAAIAVDQDLGDPRQVESLTLEVSGLGGFVIPSSRRQHVKPGKAGTAILQTSRDRRTDTPAPLDAQQREACLESTPAIQSDHETIRQLARQIVGKATDPTQAARLLQAWVFDNLRKAYSANASTALSVLDNRAGDCTEHSLLFVALARAAGIPARRVQGVVSAGEGERFFAWHEWAEIHNGSQWVSVDPIFNQVYVDATHIKLSDKHEDLSCINVIGKLKLRVVRFESQSQPPDDATAGRPPAIGSLHLDNSLPRPSLARGAFGG